MVGFWCCCQEATPTYPSEVVRMAIHYTYWRADSGWNNPAYGPFGFAPSIFFGIGSVNQPSSLSPNILAIGQKVGVYSGVGGSFEQATGNLLFEAYAYGIIRCRMPVAQGTAISSAELVLNKAAAIGTPPAPFAFKVRVLDHPGPVLIGAPTYDASFGYPWPTGQYGTLGASYQGHSFLPERSGSVQTNTTVNLTADVQGLINDLSWSASSNYVTLLIYTDEDQTLWTNNVHPGGNYPNYPASNTAVWYSEPDSSGLNAAIKITV